MGNAPNSRFNPNLQVVPNQKPALVVLAVVIGLVIVMSSANGAGSTSAGGISASSAASTSSTSTSTTHATSQAANPPTPAQAAAAAGPHGSVQAANAAVAAALGDSNRAIPRVFFNEFKNGTYQVRFNINANLLDGMVRASARRDVLDIIQAVRASGLPVQRLAVVGAFDMTDAYGNTSNIVVVSLVYSTATLNRINPDGVNWLTSNNLYMIADQRQVHSTFLS